MAVIDDDERQAEVTCVLVQEAGFKPDVLKNGTQDINGLIGSVQSQADAAICDHRLKKGWSVPYDGAQLAARLTCKGVPALLVSQYLKMDTDVSIRRWRAALPVVLRRDEVNADRIRLGLRECLQEISGKRLPHRKPRRALVRVVEMGSESGQRIVDSIIPQWNEQVAVRFPLSLVEDSIRSQVDTGVRLFADVNIGARDSDDLFLQNFELAPEADAADGLA